MQTNMIKVRTHYLDAKLRIGKRYPLMWSQPVLVKQTHLLGRRPQNSKLTQIFQMWLQTAEWRFQMVNLQESVVLLLKAYICLQTRCSKLNPVMRAMRCNIIWTGKQKLQKSKVILLLTLSTCIGQDQRIFWQKAKLQDRNQALQGLIRFQMKIFHNSGNLIVYRRTWKPVFRLQQHIILRDLLNQCPGPVHLS